MARCGFCLFILRTNTPALPEDLDEAQDWTAERYQDKSLEISAGMAQMTPPTFLYRPPRSFITRSVARGCEKCLQIMNCVNKYTQVSPGSNVWDTAAWTWSLVAAQGAYLEVSASIPGLKEYYSLFPEGELAAMDESTLRQQHPAIHTRMEVDELWLPTKPVTTSRIDSAEAFSQIRDWMRRCTRDHAECRAPKFTPTRLIDISKARKDGVVRLIETRRTAESSDNEFKYAALSHRWTMETVGFKSDQSNIISRLRSGIPLSVFSRMVLDVFSVLQRLEIAYIWIDSVCIIQPSGMDNYLDDWKKEAPTMGSVYSSAVLTISALSCDSPGLGLFDWGDGYSCPKVTELSGGHTICFGKHIPHFIDNPPPFVDMDDEAVQSLWPLFRRGWIYQERLLSKRILHFTRDEVIWECNEANACLCGHSQFGRKRISQDPRFDGNSVPIKDVLARGDWNDIVRRYSSLHLTQMQDRLPALAGIAKLYGQHWQAGNQDVEYQCGLWTNQIPESLDWNRTWETACSVGAAQAPKSSRYCLPSWTWASIDGAIEFGANQNKASITVEQYTIVSRGDAYLGDVDVSASSMLISGAMFTASLVFGDEWFEKQWYIDRVAESADYPQTRLTYVGLRWGEYLIPCIPDYDFCSKMASGAEVLCLICRRSSLTGAPRGCLVLTRLEEDVKGIKGTACYERIGYGFLDQVPGQFPDVKDGGLVMQQVTLK